MFDYKEIFAVFWHKLNNIYNVSSLNKILQKPIIKWMKRRVFMENFTKKFVTRQWFCEYTLLISFLYTRVYIPTFCDVYWHFSGILCTYLFKRRTSLPHIALRATSLRSGISIINALKPVHSVYKRTV